MLETRNQWMSVCHLLVLALFAGAAEAVESLELGVATQSGAETTIGQDNYETALSLTNTASNTGAVLLLSSFSSRSNGNDPKTGSWRLGHGATDRSLALTRSLNDGSKDTAIVNVVEIFDNVDPNAALFLEHSDDSATRNVDTFLITMAAIPLTTDGGITLARDRDDQDPDDDGTSYVFTTGSTTFVPVEKAASTPLEISVPVVAATAPRSVFVAAVFNSESDGTAAVVSFQLQTTGPGVPTWTDVGPESTRLLSGGSDTGAGVIYAIADSLAAGTHRFRLVSKTSDGNLSVSSTTLVGVSLVFSAPGGQGGYFPHFQATVASASGTNANLEPITGLEADFTLDSASDVFLAMSYSAQTTSSGAGDKGSWEAAIRAGASFVFGDENGPPSQEVDRFFGAAVDVGAPPVSTNDIGAGGLVAVAQNLAVGSYTAIGQHAITGNPMNTLEPNLVGFVPVSVATTPAVVAGLRAFHRQGRVVVEWETVAEDGTLGFHLYRLDPSDGEYRRVGRRLLRARLAAPQGSRYELVDPEAVAGEESTYLLVETGPGGPDRVHGPYRVRIGSGGEISRRVARVAIDGGDRLRHTGDRPLGKTRPRTRVVGRSAAPRAASRLDISIAESGLYSLSAAEIAQHLGQSRRRVEAAIRGGRLRLTHRGREVAWKSAGAGRGLLFFAALAESRYSNTDVFQLRLSSGRQMDEVSGRTDDVSSAESFETTALMEENHFAATAWITDPTDDFWFWDALVSGTTEAARWTTRFDLEDIGPSPAPARLELSVMGLADGPAASEHRLDLSLNGHPLGDLRWSGSGRRAPAIAVDHSLLHERDNELVVSARREPGAPPSTVLVDRLAVTYHRRFEAVGDVLAFVSRGERTISVRGFDDPRVMVVDVTDPDAARWIDDARAEAAGDGYRVSFAPPRPGRYLALTPAAVRRPVAIEAGHRSRLRSGSNRADHLIIAPRELVDAAAPLAEHRTAHGLLSKVVELEEIYDEFNHGLPDPEAIRQFLRVAHLEWSEGPRYVVLAGRGTFDPRNFQGLADSLVPVKFARGVQGVTAADALLGDVVGDDGLPEIAVGRLPVVTRGELEETVDKLIRYDRAGGGGWAEWALFAADNPDGGGDFEAAAESLEARWPRPNATQTVFLAGRPVAEARAELVSALDQGAALMTYVGHAGGDRLAAEGLLRSADLATIANGERLPVFAAATCLVNRFDIPGFPSLGESLVLHSTGGAVAAWSAAGQSFNGPATQLVAAFVDSLFQAEGPRRLGDATLAVARDEHGTGAGPHLAPLFALLGDPATEVK